MLENAVGYMMCVEDTDVCPRRTCVTWSSSSDQHTWTRAIDRHPSLARFRSLAWFGLRERVYVPCRLKEQHNLPDLKLATVKGQQASNVDTGDEGYANIGVMWCEDQRVHRGIDSIERVDPAMVHRITASAADDCAWLIRRLGMFQQS